MKYFIRKLEKKDINECLKTIRSSFVTVANDLNLTPENAPTNPAFLSAESFTEALKKGVEYFVLESNSKIAGCIALEESQKESSVYFIERLSVLPEERHKGYGKMLIDFVFDHAKKKNGRLISIGIINENTILKNWYSDYGFKETGIKNFEHLPFTVCFMEKSI